LLLALLSGCGTGSAPEPSSTQAVRPTSGAQAAPSEVQSWTAGDPVFQRPARVPPITGLNYHPMWAAMDPKKRARALDEVQASGATWVRLDISWGNIQPDGPGSYAVDGPVRKIDRAIAEANDRGLKVLLLFYWAPEWASGTSNKNGRPRDPQQYAEAAAWAAQRWDGQQRSNLHIDAIELWNEPDLNRFWAQDPQATVISDFSTLIRVAGAAVKQARPDLTVVVGGISTMDTNWLREFYAGDPGVGRSYDVLGMHAYPSPGDEAPTHFDPLYPQYSLTNITSVGQLMTEQGDPARIWITEFGWSTHDNSPGTEGWARGVTETQQAEYLLQAVDVLSTEPRVDATFWYNVWSPPLDDPHMDGFGLVTTDFQRKPAFFAMKCVAAGVCGP
jgi:hypothetical protein